MTALLIQDAIIAFLRANLAGLTLERPGRTPGPPGIFRGALPPAERDEQAFPFVIVRWLEGEDSETGDSLETFALVIGVYGVEDGGNDGEHAAAVAEQWTLVAATRLRRLLTETRVLDGRYELQWPLRSMKPAPEKQQNRFHLATITTTWSAPAPAQTLEA
ncbi:hypothetical protein [Pseudodesulfovibrio pelocollis]|uniref:hypothetical protein n=1 Tax=Pseudodesulfovibrio pelocollis TaxID=3051432 RepID=UPI00255AB1F9|nr:hypothetical protein [Pseudodesulfovibrio sp. SB368]